MSRETLLCCVSGARCPLAFSASRGDICNMDLWDEAMPKQAAPESPVEVEPHFGALSEDIIAHVMSLLPQAQR